MKRFVMVVALVSTNAMALDFETEWAKFSEDFAKFRTNKPVSVTKPVEVTDSEVIKVDPKSPERLGLKLSDPAMREKVTSLYQKPDTVVFATTIR
jgi:hypothetical protein